MAAIPYLFSEIGRIFENKPTYALVLELMLFLSVIWLLLYKRNGSKRYSKEQEERIIDSFEPESLVPDTDAIHPLLRIDLVESRIGANVSL